MPIPVSHRTLEYQYRARTHEGREIVFGALYGMTWLDCLEYALKAQIRGDYPEVHVELAPEGNA